MIQNRAYWLTPIETYQTVRFVTYVIKVSCNYFNQKTRPGFIGTAIALSLLDNSIFIAHSKMEIENHELRF